MMQSRGVRRAIALCSMLAFAACAAEEDTLGQAEEEVIVGSHAARFDDIVRGGGVVAQGISLSGREDQAPNPTGTIVIAGVPAGATIQRALLYWLISGGSDTSATINNVAVNGANIGNAGSTCWGVNNSVFRADVTAQVNGNGNYVIGGLPSTTNAGAADTDGAALFVTYQVATSGNRRRVMIRDGAITASDSNETVSDTFANVSSPLAGAGRFHIAVGDGQSFADNALILNGVTLGTNVFSGSDGALMDVQSYNVNVPLNQANMVWSSNIGIDCLLYGAEALEFTVAVCGDGVRTGGEACDQGNTANGDGCSATCDVEPGWQCSATNPSVCTPICGDGVRAGPEACDDGDTMGGDGCSATCTVEPGWTCVGNMPSVCTTTCGDGVRAGAEACDDGDTMGGDGCSATCTVEPGWTCMGNTPSVCATTCGDGIRAGAEACDDGDTMGGDGCSATCTVEPGWQCEGNTPSVCTTSCGDGIRAGAEACDDGDTMSGDGCSATCAVEPGWTCEGNTPSVCTTSCGDGIRAGAEACDDGDTMDGDGCSATCTVEPGWMCVGDTPSVCTTSCGDGVRAGAEACDDGDTMGGDGCSATCTVEPGWTCMGNTPDVCQTTCGDGIRAGAEACDDGDTTGGDGCSATCTVEPGWTCMGNTPDVCNTTCGDGTVAGTEACDDGGITAGDGCSATCTVEEGWTCEGGTCSTICGDGLVVGGEACDDDNTTSGDGCSDVCAVEANWVCDEAAPTTCDRVGVAGGGCSTGGGSSGGGLAVLALGLAFGLGRRRRRTAPVTAVAATALVALGAAAGVQRAEAQEIQLDSTAFPAERFQLAGDRAGILDVEAARTPGHLVLDLGLWIGYANDPLTLRLGEDRERFASLVADRYSGDLVASIGLGSRLELAVAAPLILSQAQSGDALMSELSSFGFGDLRITPKAALLRGGVDLALAVAVTVPTSGAEDYRGDDGLTFMPQLLLGANAGNFRIGLNAGYRVRDPKQTIDLAVDDELVGKLGVALRAGNVELMAALSLATAADDPFGSYATDHVEAHGGLGFDLSSALRLFAAGGVGMSEGYGTPDWRALAGLWLGAGHGKPAAEPVKVEPIVEPVVDLDADKDGIVTPTDQCPEEKETVNSFQDDDGCPDTLPDTDGDGMADPADECPTVAEDADGFQDDDGCPDPDNDGDGVVDTADRCVDVPGVVENGGCPDTDRDGDTVVDRLDNCPDEAGSVKFHGCKEKQLVVMAGDKIELLDIVYFATNKDIIQKRSFKLLTNVASVVKAHPEITRVVVEGHTDDQGDDAYNKDLSQRRANAVVDFLIGKGVDADKLSPIGWGEEKPIDDNTTKKGRAKNRRVEFKVEGIAGKTVE